jgi:hypothetical protein
VNSHDLYKDELRLRIGFEVGERIVIEAQPATREKAGTPLINLVRSGDRRLGLQGGEGISSSRGRRVVGGADALADDAVIFNGGLVKKTTNDDAGFGGIRYLAFLKPVSSSTKVEVAGGARVTRVEMEKR